MPFSISGTTGIVSTPTLNANNIVVGNDIDVAGNITGDVFIGNVTAQNIRTASLTATNNLITPPGTILQVVYKESNARQTISSQEIAQITDLALAIIPKRANSNFLLQSMINNNGRYVSSFGFLQNISGTWTRIGGNTNTNSANAIATTYYNLDVASNMHNVWITHMHSPSYTLGDTLIYAPGACSSWSGDITTRSIIINDRNSEDMLSNSALTIFEVAG